MRKTSNTDTISQGADPTPEEAQVILTKMEKVVELTEKELETMVQNKPRIDELHVGGKWLLQNMLPLMSHASNLSTMIL